MFWNSKSSCEKKEVCICFCIVFGLCISFIPFQTRRLLERNHVICTINQLSRTFQFMPFYWLQKKKKKEVKMWCCIHQRGVSVCVGLKKQFFYSFFFFFLNGLNQTRRGWDDSFGPVRPEFILMESLRQNQSGSWCFDKVNVHKSFVSSPTLLSFHVHVHSVKQ